MPANLAARAKSNLFTELEETGKLYRNAAYSPNLLFKYVLFTKQITKTDADVYPGKHAILIATVLLSYSDDIQADMRESKRTPGIFKGISSAKAGYHFRIWACKRNRMLASMATTTIWKEAITCGYCCNTTFKSS